MKVKAQTVARIVRWGVLAASALFFLFFSRFISEHAICPIGGFEIFFTGLFQTGFTIAGLFSGMVLTFLIMSVFSIIFRRAYCGYICPMGALQELFERLGKKILPKKIRGLRVPTKVDRALRWVKYVVLISFVVGAALGGGHWMLKGDPFIVLMGLFKGSGGNFSGTIMERLPFGFAFFVAILVFAFFLGRGFCKYICPAGAWYALLSKASPNKIVRNTEKCVGCGKCTKACPMGIDVSHLTKVTSAECIGCHECVNACPVTGALSAPIGSLSVPSALVPIAAAAVFTGSVYLSSVSMPARGARPQGPEGENGKSGESNGRMQQENPDQKGAKQVGYGGCPTCVGCGFCESGFRS